MPSVPCEKRAVHPLRLYAVLLGGKAPGARVEVHDVVFVVASSFDEARPQLRGLWFGDKKHVHVDAWLELNSCDGYAISVVPAHDGAPPGPKLFFVNVGSYPPGRFEEAHSYLFVVGLDEGRVKQKAIAMVPKEHRQRHKDNLFAVEDVLAVEVPGFVVQLAPLDDDAFCGPNTMEAKYIKL
jgi:hypothetical protein